MTKQKKSYFLRKLFTTSMKLKIVHTNLSGSTRIRTLYGDRYFMFFIDDFTRIMWVTLLRVENEFGLKIRCLRLDRVGEFISNEFNNFCEDNGI